eukprot:m.112399 g.112399  ORF g.112399 m.112399 type:complete len:422 (+) comp15325_c2_seq4:83-1348(+)
MRVLLVTVEFVDPIFSGNGVLSRTLCAGLRELGHEVFVLCAQPQLASEPAHSLLIADEHEATQIMTLPVQTWRRLDKDGCWQQMAEAVSTKVVKWTSALETDACLFVDWTTLATVQKLKLPKWIFMCFRTFSASAELHDTLDHKQFYQAQEAACVQFANKTICLSSADRASLIRVASQPVLTHDCMNDTDDTSNEKSLDIQILCPPLRPDFAGLQISFGEDARRKRRRLLCCVRLSPEKGALRFVKLIEIMRADILQYGLVPTLCGAAANVMYAEGVKTALKQACAHAEIIEHFLDASGFQQLFEETLVNVHPAVNDAFGMTIVEAAACGVISLVSQDGTVGAVDLFKAQQARGQVTIGSHPALGLLLADVMDAEQCATVIRSLLQWPSAKYNQTAQQSYQVANAWTQADYASSLAKLACL